MKPHASISALSLDDLPAVIKLHNEVLGPGRFTRTAYRVREGAPALSPACRKLVVDGVLAGAVQMTDIEVGGSSDGMLLGPLVVARAHSNAGHGQNLIEAAVAAAGERGVRYIVLVGDPSYYARAGFQQIPANRIILPGPVDPARLLIRFLNGADEIPAGQLHALPQVHRD